MCPKLAMLSVVGVVLALAGCTPSAKVLAYEVSGGDPYKGKDKIQYYGCGSCHTIPGIPGADGLVGPPLTRMGSRVYVAGVLTNTPWNMMRWIQNPPKVDQLTAMPNLNVTPSDARDIAGYLYTLK